MMLIDTHCHLYLPEFADDLTQVIANAADKGIKHIYLPAIDSTTHAQTLQLAGSTNESGVQFHAMMGLHPCSVKENFEEELSEVYRYFNTEKNLCAVGEVGLDYYWDVTFKAQQQKAFDAQINLAMEKNLPVIIHSRNSTADCIDMVKPYRGKVTGIFHCFSGTEAEAREVMDMGMHLGIGGVVTYKNTNLRDIVKAVGLSHVVLETDAPYLSPVPHRGKRNEPAFVKLVAEAIAAVTGISTEEVADITTANAKTVFKNI